MIFKAGQVFAHFKIIRMLGEGGMGQVYLAEDQKLNRQVALKILQAEFFNNPDHLERFRREAKTAAQISHPNVMSIFDLDSARDEETGQDLSYIVMEYITGESLTNYLTRRNLKTTDLLRIAEKIASGLSAAHKLNIIHRDIKTDNIRIDESGEPKILDFGLAKPLEVFVSDGDEDSTRTVSSDLTQDGKIMGTVNYMSPEQARGEKTDTRSDIFSFGIMIYRMFTGDFPFEGKDKVSILAKILESRHIPIRQKNEALPPELERIVDKCLQKNPDDRYQDTRDLAIDLRNLRRQFESGISDTTSFITDRENIKTKTFTLGWGKVSLVVIVLAALIVLGKELFFGGEKAHVTTGLQAKENALAVLGFDNKTGDAELNWMVSGLPEILMTDLAQGGSINLISRSRILDALGENSNDPNKLPSHQALIDAASDLGASNVLSGSFYKMGDKIRIDARLEDVSSGKILLGEKVIGDDPFALVDSLTQKIAQSLNMKELLAGNTEVSDITSSSPEAYKNYILGMEQFGLSNLEEAEKFFNKAIQIDSTFALPYMRIGMVNAFRGRGQKAREYFQQSLRFEHKLPLKDRNLLDIYADIWLRQKFDDAYVKIKSFVNNYPDDKEARTFYGIFLSQLIHEDDKALAQLDTVLMLDPKFQLALEQKINIYVRQENYDKAIEFANRIKKYYPDEPTAYENLASIYEDRAQYDDVIRECKRILELVSDNRNAYTRLIRAYIFKRDFDTARKYIEDFGKLYKDDPFIMLSYYSFLENIANWEGKFKQSLEYQRTSLKTALRTNDSSQIYANYSGLAHYFENIGSDDSARVYINKAKNWANRFNLIGCSFLLVTIDPDRKDEAAQIFDTSIKNFKAALPEEMWYLADDLSLLFDGFANADTANLLAAYRDMVNHESTIGSSDRLEFSKILIATGNDEEALGELKKVVEGPDATNWGFRQILARYYMGIANESLGRNDQAIAYYQEVLKYWGKPDVTLEEITDTRKRLKKLTS